MLRVSYRVISVTGRGGCIPRIVTARRSQPTARWPAHRRCCRRRRRRCYAGSRLPAWARAARGPARTASAGPTACRSPTSRRHPEHAPDRAHRRADDGEPLVRQPARDGPLPGAGRAERRRPDRAATGKIANFNPDARRTGLRPARELAVPARTASPARPGTPATSPRTTAATTASSGRADRSRCASGTSPTCRSPTRWPSTSRSASATSARCWPRPTPTAASCSPAPRRGLIATDAHDLHDPGRQRHDLGPPRRAPHRLRRLLPGRSRAGLIIPGSVSHRGAPRASTSSTSSTPTSPPASCPRSRSSTPTTTRPPRRTRRTSRSASEFIAKVVHALMKAPTWKNTALFITYDEHGGYYDHVPPPRAIKPDNIKPILAPGDVPAAMTATASASRLIVVSPWAARELRLERGPGPHLDHRLHRAQVEPPGDDLPRRQRPPDDRLLRLPHAPPSRSRPSSPRPAARPGPGPVPRPGPEPAAAARRRGGPHPRRSDGAQRRAARA